MQSSSFILIKRLCAAARGVREQRGADSDGDGARERVMLRVRRLNKDPDCRSGLYWAAQILPGSFNLLQYNAGTEMEV